MAKVSVTGDRIDIEVQGLDKLWSFKSRMTVPLGHVRGARADPEIAKRPKGWRGPGTHVPGIIYAGTFHQDGGRVFWDVHNPAKVVVIELADEHFRRLVIEVEDPGATATEIEAALHHGPR